MGALLSLYYILFEREKMHRFNRFYLLSALAFSLALPFITVITYIKEVKITSTPDISTSSSIISTTITEQPVDYLFYLGWCLYAIVTFIMIVRFTKNVYHFTHKISVNPSVQMESAKLILLEEKILPHTFLNYIFINREEHEAHLIEDELYTHEYTHVKQKHTLDILFIEALKTFFWFNPLLYFYKKAIQLNHEFLADEKVIDTTANTVYYQSLLLEKAIVGTTFSIASNLNFSLTKKRFLMMTKTTSIAKASLLKVVIAPVAAGLMMLFCTETVAQHSTIKQTENPMEAGRKAAIERLVVSDSVFDSLKTADPEKFSDNPDIRMKDTEFKFYDKQGNLTDKIVGYKNLTAEQKKKFGDIEAYGMGSFNIYETPKETDPRFPGGDPAFMDFWWSNFKNKARPEIKKDVNITIALCFMVGTDGNLTDIRIEYDGEHNEDIDLILNAYKNGSTEILEQSPKWKHGTKDGKPVKVGKRYPLKIDWQARPKE